MRKRSERTLKELYDLTRRIKEPKITPVLKGSCRIQGPVDDLEIHLQGACHSDEKKNTLLPKNHTTMSETGTCTVCSAPCSLCMHYKSESVFSYNRSVRTEADSSSVINAGEIPIFKSRLRSKLQRASSETSNLLSTSSSHDSYSENTKRKTKLRASEENDASDVVDMPQVLFSEKVKKGQPFNGEHAPDQLNLNSITPELNHRFSSEKVDGQSELECHGDNILCITGTTDSNVAVCDSIVDIEEKGSSFVVVNNDVITDEGGNDNQDHVAGGSHFISNTSNATVDSSLLHNSCNLASVNNVSYVKSQLPSCINDVSPVTVPLSSHPEDAKSSLLKGGSMVIEGSLKLQPQSVINNSVEAEKVESSLVSLSVGKSPENDSSTCPKGQVFAENRIKSGLSSGTSQIDALCQDTIAGTVKPFDNCSEDHHANDILERDDAIMAAAKDEYQNVQPQAVTVGENYELDIALDDVKVCDICGDAGREDFLAICSRCSDGAEHTYCMQEMLDKVPEGEWLCEECKIKGAENQNADESEAVSGILKSAFLIATNKNSMSISIPKKARKLDTRLTDLDTRGSAKGLQIPQFSFKKQIDHLEEGKASELSGSSIERASPRKKPVLSRQLSAKNMLVGKVKSAIMETSSEARPTKGSDAFSRAKNYLHSSSFKGLPPPLYSPHGNFSRSVSFNNSNVNQNLKTLIENAPSKQRSTRDNDLRKDSLFKPSPSITSKYTTSGLSNTEPGKKNSALQQSRIEDLRTLTDVKERNTVENKNFSAIGSSSIRPSATTTASNYPLKVDSKFVQLQSDGKMNNSSETGIRNSIEGVGVDELDSNEGKKQVSCSSKNAEYSNGNYNADNPKRLKVDKEGILRSVSAVDGSLKKFEIASLHGIIKESANKGTGTLDSTTTTGLRPSTLGGTFRSQRGNETGRVTHHSSLEKLKVSAHKTSAVQKWSEVEKKGNKWREVVDASMSKTELKCNTLDMPVKLPSDSGDMIFKADSKHITSASGQKSSFVERNNDKIFSKDSSQVSANILASIGSVRSHVLSVGSFHRANSIRDTPTQLSAKSLAEPTRGKPPILENPSSVSAAAKPLLECPSSVMAVQKPTLLAKPLSSMAVPKLDCIWQGSFNVTGARSPCKTFFGIQAHLSKCASHRVFQVATKAPANIQLEEVSHISSCPLQILRAGAQEENIALFFFAKDNESYEKSYRKLMDNMHKNDLALRGNIDGTELLIFTSNKLPVNAQRWNKMHYLWGMFRSKNGICSPVMGEQKSSFSNQDISAPPISDVSNAHNLEISLKLKKLSESTESQGMQRESINGVDFRTVSSVIEDKASKTPVASTQNLFNQVLAGAKIPQEHPSFPISSSSLGKSEPLRAITDTPNLSLQISTIKSCSAEKSIWRSDGTCQMKCRSARRKKAKRKFYQAHGCLKKKEITASDFVDRNGDDSDGRNGGDSDGLADEIGVESRLSSLIKASSVPSISPNCTKGADSINIEEENGEKETPQAVMGILGDDQIGKALGADLVGCELTDNRKRPRSCSPIGDCKSNYLASRSARRKKAKRQFYQALRILKKKEKTASDLVDRYNDDSDGLGVESRPSSLIKASSVPSISPHCTKGAASINIEEENGEKESSQAVMGILGVDQIGNALRADLVSCELTDNRKRRRSCSPEAMLQPSREMPKSTIETAVLMTEKPSWLSVDDEREQKNILYPGVTSIINENASAQSSSKVHPLHSIIFKNHQAEESICTETPVPQNTRVTEMSFFPIDLPPVQNANSNKIIEIPSSDEDTPETSSPDLELALGGTSKPTKPFVLSSLFSSVGAKQQRQPGPSGDNDDAPASLSLSL